MIKTIEVNASFIPLGQDKVTILDTNDYENLQDYKWAFTTNNNKIYYVQRNIYLGYVNKKKKGKTVSMHRQIMDHPKGKHIDHINGNGLDNRRSNLRICSNRQNQQNQKNRQKKKISKYPGVSFDKRVKKWRAYIHINGKQKSLGYFENSTDGEKWAAERYELACRELLQEQLICKTNKPLEKRYYKEKVE